MDKINFDLEHMDGGEVVAKFNRKLVEMVRNIIDPNTPAKAARQVVLTVKAEPGETREVVSVEAAITTKFAGPHANRTVVYLDRKSTGEVVASEQQRIRYDSDEPVQ